jgi:hypothetical protein
LTSNLCATDCAAVSELRDEMTELRRDLTRQQQELTTAVNTMMAYLVSHHVPPSQQGGVNVTVGGAHVDVQQNQIPAKPGATLAERAGHAITGMLNGALT